MNKRPKELLKHGLDLDLYTETNLEGLANGLEQLAKVVRETAKETGPKLQIAFDCAEDCGDTAMLYFKVSEGGE